MGFSPNSPGLMSHHSNHWLKGHFLSLKEKVLVIYHNRLQVVFYDCVTDSLSTPSIKRVSRNCSSSLAYLMMRITTCTAFDNCVDTFAGHIDTLVAHLWSVSRVIGEPRRGQESDKADFCNSLWWWSFRASKLLLKQWWRYSFNSFCILICKFLFCASHALLFFCSSFFVVHPETSRLSYVCFNSRLSGTVQT
jgi:hypothetical protein